MGLDPITVKTMLQNLIEQAHKHTWLCRKVARLAMRFLCCARGPMENCGVYLRDASPRLMGGCLAVLSSKNTDKGMKTDLRIEQKLVEKIMDRCPPWPHFWVVVWMP